MKQSLQTLGVYAVAACLAGFSLLPIFWMVLTSLKPLQEIYATTELFTPNMGLLNYEYFLVPPSPGRDRDTVERMNFQSNFVLFFSNSLKYTVSATLTTIAVAVLAAYAFSRIKMSGKRILLISVMLFQMLPRASILVPLYKWMDFLHLINTDLALYLLYIIVGLPLCVWMLAGFFDAVPKEIEEAALVDGCSRLGALFRVILPIARNGVIAAAVITFITCWKELQFPLIFSTSNAVKPLSVGLLYFFMNPMYMDWGKLMAMTTITTIPSLVFFAIFRRYLISGMVEGAIKG